MAGTGPPGRVVDLPLRHGRLYALRVDTPGVAAIQGTLRTAPSVARGEAALQQLAAAQMGIASQARDAAQVADLLDARGASLAVWSELHRIAFSARACTADLPLVVELLADGLRAPRWDPGDVEEDRAQLIAERRHVAADAASMAADGLSRLLYPPGHLRHRPRIEDETAQLAGAGLADARAFHDARIGANAPCIVVVGDIDPERVAAQFERHLGDGPARALPPLACTHAWPAQPGRQGPPMRLPAPASDMFVAVLGHALALRCDHPDYTALWLANHILGGGFGSRLGRAVREERGLTYDIRASLPPPYRDIDGHLQVEVALGADALEDGLAATRAAIARFVNDGVGAEELAARQRAAIGAFHIGLATLHGLGEAILAGAECGHGADHLHDVPARIAAVTPAQLDRVIATHLHPDALQVVIAGPWGAGQAGRADVHGDVPAQADADTAAGADAAHTFPGQARSGE